MKMLLVEPEQGRTWGKNNQFVGLLRIGNWLQQTGHSVEYVQYPTMPKEPPDRIYVTSMFTYDYPKAWEAVRFYKTWYPSTELLLGGIYATICPDHATDAGADKVFVGQHPQARKYPPDPTLLPHKQDFAYLFTSYGCNRACTYCATHILFGKGIRQTPVERVLGEIEFLVSRGFKEIWLGDDNLLYNADNHINKICEEIIRRGLKLTFKVPGGMSAKDLTQETAYLMRRAGFKKISFAIESVSKEVRSQMGRANNATPADLETALVYADNAGFDRTETSVFFIVGLPYQTLDDMLDTLIYLFGLGVWAHPHRLTPIPNTVDWKRMKLEEWDYTDLDYRTFVAPNQDNFEHDDLKGIYRIARFFNMGQRYSGSSWFNNNGINELFRTKLSTKLSGR